MALGTFAPGYYTQTLDGDDCGLVEGVRRLRRRFKWEPIRADKWGDTTIDGVYRGGDCFLSVVFKEWKDPVSTLIANMFVPADLGAVGEVGELITNFAKALVLTAQAGSPAAAAGPVTITASQAITAADNDMEFLLGNLQRDVPVLFQLIPYDDSGTLRWFSITNPA